MSQITNLPWISRNIQVTDSTDPTLVGMSGMVLDETMRTILVNTGSKEVILAKDTIRFTIDDEKIDGSLVGQRPEERIGKAYRRS